MRADEVKKREVRDHPAPLVVPLPQPVKLPEREVAAPRR
jgi:hypothetical protein